MYNTRNPAKITIIMNAEHFINQTMEAGGDENLGEYKAVLSDLSGTMYHARYPATEGWQVVSSRSSLPINISSKYNPNRPAVQAAMWTTAIKTRGDNNTVTNYHNPGKEIKFGEVWNDTALQPLAEQCERALEDLVPTLSNTITSIDIEAMKKHRQYEIEDSYHKEIVVFLGLNGAGKDFLIGYLTNFLAVCGIDNEVVKMPDPNDSLFETIDSFLHGKKNLNPNAAQLLMLASGANTELSDGKLSILNRHAMFDTMIFGNDELHPAILSTHPLFKVVTHTIIVDRHPSTALQSVKDRNKEQRIFERKLEQGLHLRNRYAALTALPGVRWLNTDFDTSDVQKQISYSVDRLIHYVMSFGLLQRKLVRNKSFENIGQADEFLHKKWIEFEEANNL